MISIGTSSGGSTNGTPFGKKSDRKCAPWPAKPMRVTPRRQRRHREGDDDVAGRREAVGQHAEQVAEQDEDEEREDEREVLLALVADVVATMPAMNS